jgi:cytochrome c556
MNFKVFAGVAVATVIAASGSGAQEDPIATRQKLMKDVGAQAKVVGDMLQGKSAFDAAAAKAAFKKMSADFSAFPNHFPEGSDQGKTEALPAIWQNKADFEQRAQKASGDAAAAATAVDGGEDAFKQAAGAVFNDCKGCHEAYRRPS